MNPHLVCLCVPTRQEQHSQNAMLGQVVQSQFLNNCRPTSDSLRAAAAGRCLLLQSVLETGNGDTTRHAWRVCCNACESEHSHIQRVRTGSWLRTAGREVAQVTLSGTSTPAKTHGGRRVLPNPGKACFGTVFLRDAGLELGFLTGTRPRLRPSPGLGSPSVELKPLSGENGPAGSESAFTHSTSTGRCGPPVPSA